MQHLSLIPILILLLYLLVSGCLTSLCRLNRSRVYWLIASQFQSENNCILSLIQIALVLKLQVVSTLTNKWVVSLMEYDWLVFNIS